MSESGELDLYFNRFNKELGLQWFPGMLKDLSAYDRYHEYLMSLGNVVIVKYEELFEFREQYFAGICTSVFGSGIDKNSYIVDFENIDKRTKKRKDPFYWKSVSRNFKNFLSEEMMDKFYANHEEMMDKLGYQREDV